MDYTPVIVVAIGFALNLIGLLNIYRSAGSIANRFGIGFLLGTLLGAAPLAAMLLDESISAVMSEPISSIPPYILLFAVLLIIFIVLILLWLRLVEKTSSIHRQAGRLRRSVEDADDKITNVSMEIVNANKSIDEINKKIRSRNDEIAKILGNPR